MPRGGKRAGAGRKPNPENVRQAATDAVVDFGGTPYNGEVAPPLALGAIDKMTPLEFLEATMRGQIEPNSMQVKAAITAAQYRHKKMHDGGAKEEQQRKATEVASKFGAPSPPRLVVNNK